MIVPMASDANSHTSSESEQIPRQVEPQSSHLKSGIWMREELELLRNHLPSYKKLKRRQRTSYLKTHIIQDIKRWWKDRYIAGALKDKKRSKEWRKKKTVCELSLSLTESSHQLLANCDMDLQQFSSSEKLQNPWSEDCF